MCYIEWVFFICLNSKDFVALFALFQFCSFVRFISVLCEIFVQLIHVHLIQWMNDDVLKI